MTWRTSVTCKLTGKWHGIAWGISWNTFYMGYSHSFLGSTKGGQYEFITAGAGDSYIMEQDKQIRHDIHYYPC